MFSLITNVLSESESQGKTERLRENMNLNLDGSVVDSCHLRYIWRICLGCLLFDLGFVFRPLLPFIAKTSTI